MSASESERKPGRSFTNPKKPMGEELIERASPFGGDPKEGVYGRTSDFPASGHGVAERAKGVAVLRKAEELMASGNPSGLTEAGRRRALELAAGRVGISIHEYERIVKGDEELAGLEAEVMDAARTHVPNVPGVH